MLHAGKALIIDTDRDFSHFLCEQLAVLEFEPHILDLIPAAPTRRTVRTMLLDTIWLFIDVQIAWWKRASLVNPSLPHLVVMGWDAEIMDTLKLYASSTLYLNKACAKSLPQLAQALNVQTHER
ncbi:MAG: hypothetical protein C7B45_13160 [Sulfobacillus acidophilus]|uniref:Uncharacterized protein n=1 Tax=Sulfobacillus acidophilus TaxID=53633 RepID=A0A2T2WF09_9FIRM|nr:MAG: hypothetical protein C7B45_13160 [Sulfobacillus acidophilus]